MELEITYPIYPCRPLDRTCSVSLCSGEVVPPLEVQALPAVAVQPAEEAAAALAVSL